MLIKYRVDLLYHHKIINVFALNYLFVCNIPFYYYNMKCIILCINKTWAFQLDLLISLVINYLY